MKKIISIVITAAIALTCNMAFAEDDEYILLMKNYQVRATGIKKIIFQTMALDGVMNEKIHKTFWSYMPLNAKAENNPWLTYLRDFIANAAPYQKELWHCADLSFKSKRIVKTDLLQQLQTSMIEQASNISESRKGTINHKKIDKSIEQGIKDADALLIAASNHSTWYTSEFGSVKINEDHIQQVLTNVDAMVKRIDILLNPKYYS